MRQIPSGIRSVGPLLADALPVELWWLERSVETPDEDAGRRFLRSSERIHADALRDRTVRDRFIFFRSRLRWLLANRTGVRAPDLPFRAGPHGKPALALSNAPAFNLSHSGDCGILAICDAPAVGIDLECLQRRRPALDLANRFWSASEQAELKARPEPERFIAFLRGWVRKEAWVKALGTGLQTPLDRFSVSLSEADNDHWMRDPGGTGGTLSWAFRTPELPSREHIAALAIGQPASAPTG